MSTAKETDSKFTVSKLSSWDFYCIKSLPNLTTIEIQIDWADIKSVVYDRAEPMSLRLNYFSQNSEEKITFDENSWIEIDKMDLVYSNESGIAISKLKYDDLVLKTLKYIPSEHHAVLASIDE